MYNTWIHQSHTTQFDTRNGLAILPMAEVKAQISTVYDKKTKKLWPAAASLVGINRRALAWIYEKENLNFEDETSLTWKSLWEEITYIALKLRSYKPFILDKEKLPLSTSHKMISPAQRSYYPDSRAQHCIFRKTFSEKVISTLPKRNKEAL